MTKPNECGPQQLDAVDPREGGVREGRGKAGEHRKQGGGNSDTSTGEVTAEGEVIPGRGGDGGEGMLAWFELAPVPNLRSASPLQQ